MALPLRSALRSASRYVLKNPVPLLNVARHALNPRLAIPLDALRWFVENTPPGKKSPTDVTINAVPPAVHFGATVELMGSKLRVSAAIRVEELRVDPDELRLMLRLSSVEMKVLDRSETPISGLIKSGALDLSKPGNLANFMPKKPPALVEARDDYLVLDLMRVPKLANNLRLRKMLQRLTAVVHVAAVMTVGGVIFVGLGDAPN